MKRYFGTDGIRGPVDGPLMQPEWVFQFGRALGRFLAQKHADEHPVRVLIGRDTRASGPALEAALSRGLLSQGIEVHSAGVLPTPAIALLTVSDRFHGGIVISASHNPASDNGIKLFDRWGQKLNDDDEHRIEDLIDEGYKHSLQAAQPATACSTPQPSPYPYPDAAGRYLEQLQHRIGSPSLEGFKIVVDCGHGATCDTTPQLLQLLGAEVIAIHTDPDGRNINDGVGSEHTEILAKTVVDQQAHLGLAHDGDGDRVIFCDARGRRVDGDRILMLLARFRRQSVEGLRSPVVVTIQSNLAVDTYLRDDLGLTVERTPVGDRHVATTMRARNSQLGGENSGHILLSDWSTTGDGLLAAIALIQGLQSAHGADLAQLTDTLPLFPQKTTTLPVAERIPLETLGQLQAAIQSGSDRLGNRGRLFVRYSGTELLLRFLVEAEENHLAEAILADLIKAVHSDMTKTVNLNSPTTVK